MAKVPFPSDRGGVLVGLAGMAGAVGANLLFDDDPTDTIQRRLQRIGFEDIQSGTSGNNWAVDFKWPEYPGLEQRRVGNSIAIQDDETLAQATIRFPGFPEDEYPRSVGEDILNDTARAAGLDTEDDTWINTWAPFFAPHVRMYGIGARSANDSRRPADGYYEGKYQHTVEDALEMAKFAMDRLEQEVY